VSALPERQDMPQLIIEIVCALCSCHFSSAELNEDDILCKVCGHSLDDDHAAGYDGEPETVAAV
jgi:hypothetical protein